MILNHLIRMLIKNKQKTSKSIDEDFQKNTPTKLKYVHFHHLILNRSLA